MLEKDIIEYLEKKYGSYEQDAVGWYDFPSYVKRKFSYLNMSIWYHREGLTDRHSEIFKLGLL